MSAYAAKIGGEVDPVPGAGLGDVEELLIEQELSVKLPIGVILDQSGLVTRRTLGIAGCEAKGQLAGVT